MENNLVKDKLIRNHFLEVRKSPVHGWGVFATFPIQGGTILEENHGIMFTQKEWKKSYGLVSNAFNFPRQDGGAWQRGEGNVILPMGLGSVFNTNVSEKVNADWYTDEVNNIIVYFATKDIMPGEEIFVNYYNEMIIWEKMIKSGDLTFEQ